MKKLALMRSEKPTQLPSFEDSKRNNAGKFEFRKQDPENCRAADSCERMPDFRSRSIQAGGRGSRAGNDPESMGQRSSPEVRIVAPDAE